MDDNSRKRPLSGQWLIDTAERVRQKPRVGSIDTSNATSNFVGQGIQHTGQGDFNVNGNVNITTNNAAPTSAAEEECLRSLFITDPSEDRTALKRKKGNRAAGTCEWILETEELTAWLGQGQTSNVLWLYGNPGTGKSTMAIFLTEELSTGFSALGEKTLAYFFCDSSFEKQKTATSVIRGLLYQLVKQKPKLLDHILPKYKERGADLFKSFDALWTIFMAAAADEKTGQKYCIIDALDECDRESQKTLLQQFQGTFLNQNVSSKIRILITSRPYSEIYEYLNEFANEDLASFPQAEKDIDLCIEDKVADLIKKKNYTNKVRQQVISILRDKAESTFLWVGLACEELKEVASKDAVQMLQSMPKGLHSLYKKLLEAAQGGFGANTIQHILSLVAVCIRPLSVLELSEACQLYEEETDIETRVQFTRDQIASCRLMIIIQDEKVLLLHQSVKDYLVGANSDYFVDELNAHATIAHRCLNVLIQDFHGERSGIHFFPYAAQEWPNHAHMAQSRFEVSDSEVEFFQVDSPSREHWLTAVHHRLARYDIPRQMSVLHIAGRWGITSLVDYNTKQFQESNHGSFINLDCINRDGETPIELAVKWGSINVISKLLCLGAKVNENVVIAARENWTNGEEVMALLLDQRGNQITITEDIIKAAAEYHHEKIIALLFKRRGDQITITPDIFKAIASVSRKETMTLLFNHSGRQITITEDIVKAIAKGYSGKEVMTLLFDRFGDQVTITKGIVKAAAKSDSGKEVMELLFDKFGYQITITADIFKAAAKNTSGKEVIELLCNRFEDQITITEDIVEAAAENWGGGKEIIGLLCERFKDQIIITENILKAAARNTRQADGVMALLLDHFGNQITITEDVLKTAAGNSTSGQGVMELLLDRQGDQVTITEDVIKIAVGTLGTTALLFNRFKTQITITENIVKNAAQKSRSQEMALLFDCWGDQIIITEGIIKAAAANYSGKEIIALLTNRRRDQIILTEDIIKAAAGNRWMGKEIIVFLLDQFGDQMIVTEEVVKAAATSGQDEVLNILSQRNLILSDWDKWYRISNFYNAAYYGDIHTIEQLLDQGVNPDLKDTEGKTPLWVAAAGGEEAIVKILVQRSDVNINAKSDSGTSPFLESLRQGFEQVATILMESGADLRGVDENGNTAAIVARENKCKRLAEILKHLE